MHQTRSLLMSTKLYYKFSYFVWNLSLTWGFLQPPYCCALWSKVLKEVHILCPLYPQDQCDAANSKDGN